MVVLKTGARSFAHVIFPWTTIHSRLKSSYVCTEFCAPLMLKPQHSYCEEVKYILWMKKMFCNTTPSHVFSGAPPVIFLSTFFSRPVSMFSAFYLNFSLSHHHHHHRHFNSLAKLEHEKMAAEFSAGTLLFMAMGKLVPCCTKERHGHNDMNDELAELLAIFLWLSP